MTDMTLIRCEMVDGSGFVTLPACEAERYAALGRVRLPTPQPDARYAAPRPTPISATWRAGRFWPASYLTRDGSQ